MGINLSEQTKQEIADIVEQTIASGRMVQTTGWRREDHLKDLPDSEQRLQAYRL
ncbi:MAG: hypothetical protein ACREB7_12480 [Sphingopyxis sp.]|uniref:hypothetical protein n=1 Tax=Sphingopyxis sp. TaxID=1908224 RepID=UPI003D6CF9EA